jgi:hypothetical protein
MCIVMEHALNRNSEPRIPCASYFCKAVEQRIDGSRLYQLKYYQDVPRTDFASQHREHNHR